MDPVVEGALIGVGGSVIVAVVSFVTNTATTLRTLSEARHARVWDKRASAYVDAVTGVRWSQERRKRQLATLAQGVPLIPTSGRDPEKPPPVDWGELTSRILAFASPAVLQAFQSASDAGIEARTHFRKWEESGREIRAQQLDSEPGPMSFVHSAKEAAVKAVQAANDKDDALIEAIRVDLHGKQGQALRLLSHQLSEKVQPGAISEASSE